MKAMQYTLDQLNSISTEAFVATLSGIFEHSPWVAEIAAQQRPFASIDELHRKMSNIVETAGEEKQLALINAHPELAGKAAVRGELTAESTREQSGAGLAVRGYDRHGIIANFEARVNNSRAEELRASLDQIYRIARFRLDDLIDA
jgi:2-oxo-4-hydroxy-4-carboxy-5-ureidoimidazoline decarboxylase